jgi:peptide subunit release factor 1 (eRF1)
MKDKVELHVCECGFKFEVEEREEIKNELNVKIVCPNCGKEENLHIKTSLAGWDIQEQLNNKQMNS